MHGQLELANHNIQHVQILVIHMCGDNSFEQTKLMGAARKTCRLSNKNSFTRGLPAMAAKQLQITAGDPSLRFDLLDILGQG